MKRRGSLHETYKLKKKNLGGLFGKNPSGTVDTKTVQTAQAVGTIGSGLVDAVDPGNAYGVQSSLGAGASGALKGAAAGAALGPPGIIGGAILGGITSLISNGSKAEEEEQQRMAKKIAINKQADQITNSRIAADPTLVGNPNATMYNRGGTIKGKPAGKFALSGTMLGKYRAVRSQVPDISIRPNRMMEDGGIIPTDLEGRAIIEGPDHAQGGVKVPELGVELEGGETMDGDFVFSKELGFADKHKKIIKALDKTSKDDSPLSIYTAEKLAEQEEKLKAHQESLKKALGEENEIDNTAQEMKNVNKTVPFKNQTGLKKKALGGKVELPGESTPMGVDLVTSYRNQLQSGLPASVTPINVNTTPILENEGSGSSVRDIAERVVPYASNLVNAFRRLPPVPEPIPTPTQTPRYMNMDASRNEAVRAVRGANRNATNQLASSSATAATTAANLTQGIRAVNEVNQNENNINADIANRTIAQNLDITRENNAKLEYRNAQQVSRQLKQQELNSENLANFADKFQLQTRDRNLRSLEDDRLMLQVVQDNTGAAWRAGREIFRRRLTPESFKALDERMADLETMNQQEREATLEALRQGITSIGVSGANTPSVLVDQTKKRK